MDIGLIVLRCTSGIEYRPQGIGPAHRALRAAERVRSRCHRRLNPVSISLREIMNSKAQAAIRKVTETLCFDLLCRRFCFEVLCGGGTSGLRRKRIASIRKSRCRMARLWPFCRPCRSGVSRHAVAAIRDVRCRRQPGDRIAPRNWRSSVRPVTSPGALR